MLKNNFVSILLGLIAIIPFLATTRALAVQVNCYSSRATCSQNVDLGYCPENYVLKSAECSDGGACESYSVLYCDGGILDSPNNCGEETRPICDPPASTPTPTPEYCGDSACNNGETCGSCSQDCGPCGTVTCSSNADCNDNNTCTTDTCSNPGTFSSSCSNADNGSCSGPTVGSIAVSTNNANVSWSIAGAGSGSGTTGLYSNLAFATYTISITNPTNYTCSPDAWSKAIDSGAPNKTFTVTCVFSALPTAFLTNFDTTSGYTRLTSMGAPSNGTLTGSASAPAGTITNILIVIRESTSGTDCSVQNRDWNGSSWQAACTSGGYTIASFTPSQNPSWTSTNTPGAADLIVGKTYRVYVNAYDSLGNQSGWAYYKSIVYTLPANNALYVSQSVPTSIVAGQTATATVTMTNNGTTTWTTGTNYKLGSQNPADNTTWGLLRVPVGSSISPGSTTTFSFTITAPSTPGTYNFQWRMVQELVEWFGNTTPNVTITVTAPTNNALYVSQSVPTSIVAGQTATATVTMTNNGTTTWTTGTNYKLGSQNPADNTTWGLSRVTVGSSISPGASKIFSFTITAPSTPGTYNFQWRMVQELVEWFGNITPNVAITVTATNPVVSNVQAGAQDYCSHSDQRSISWSYSDPLAKAQASYTVQIGRDPLFADYDFSYSGIGSSTNYTQTGLSYNTTYYARVKAVNSSGIESAWASSAAWTTPLHVYPAANFTFAPSRPEIGATTTFTNTSTCSPSCPIWSWNFGDSGTSTSQSPTHAFSAASTYSVQLTATDTAGYSCSTTKSVPVQQRIPGWKEVLPR